MTLRLLDWRRQVAALYAAVRACPDPPAAHGFWVQERQRLFRDHPESPDRQAVLRHAPYDAALRFEVAVSPASGRRLELATGTDGIVPFHRIGTVHLGDLGSLDVWWLASYGGGVWLPMRDAARDTYGGGRYVLDTVKGADLGGTGDHLVVDLNFAYQPSCAYDERWACPLAPAGNTLSVPVHAGELTAKG